MHYELTFFLIILSFTGHAQPGDSIYYQQKAVREARTFSDLAVGLRELRDNGGIISLKKDHLVFKSREKKVPEEYDFTISYCDILVIKRFQWGGFMPNRIRIITKTQEIVLATFKRKQLVLMTRARMALCPSMKNDALPKK